MKITRLGPTRPLISLTGLLSGGDAGPAGQVPTSVGSNGAIAWGSNVALITVNGTTKVLGPYVNFANGSNTTVTVDQVGAVASNTIRIHATGGAASFGSNSNAVGEANAPGASSDSSRADHVHLGVRTISHASNTFAGPITLTASGLLGITSPSANTLNFSAIGDGGGSGSSGITVQDEGSPLSTAATTLDFVGAGVTASGTGATKTITIAGGGGGDLTRLAETVLGADASDITFTGLSNAYRDLIIVAQCRGTNAGNDWSRLYLRMGDGSIDTGNNYGHVWTQYGTGSGGGNNTAGENAGWISNMPSATSTSGAFSATRIELLGYANTSRFKTWIGMGSGFGASENYTWSVAGVYRSTSAEVDQIRVFCPTGDLKTGSRVTIYGRA